MEEVNNNECHVDLRTDPFQEGGSDGRRPRQGPIIRDVLRHLETS